VGIKLFSNSSFDCCYNKVPVERTSSTPDPEKYVIKKSYQKGKYLVILINYPDCKNYEGNKILVFENIYLDDLKRQGIIDPHFSDNGKYYSPIARFEPTNRGWNMAVSFVSQ